MKRTHATALLGAALIAACSERQPATAPIVRVRALTTTDVTGDRMYTWSFSCGGKGWIGASWTWVAGGAAIVGSGGSASCSNSDKVSGTGVRPGSADGFQVRVGDDLLGSTFDPSLPFSAQFKGTSEFCYLSNWKQIKCDKNWGTLTVDS
jgi:hypothetical protein